MLYLVFSKPTNQVVTKILMRQALPILVLLVFLLTACATTSHNSAFQDPYCGCTFGENCGDCSSEVFGAATYFLFDIIPFWEVLEVDSGLDSILGEQSLEGEQSQRIIYSICDTEESELLPFIANSPLKASVFLTTSDAYGSCAAE